MLIAKLTQPIRASVGNLINSDNDLIRHWKIFKMLDFSMLCAGMLIGTCYLVLFQPFIQLWLGASFLLPMQFVILLVFTLCVGYSCEALFFFRSAMGKFNLDRNEMVLSAVLNVAGSILLVRQFGITGIQLGTLLGMIPILTGRSPPRHQALLQRIDAALLEHKGVSYSDRHRHSGRGIYRDALDSDYDPRLGVKSRDRACGYHIADRADFSSLSTVSGYASLFTKNRAYRNK